MCLLNCTKIQKIRTVFPSQVIYMFSTYQTRTEHKRKEKMKIIKYHKNVKGKQIM